MTPMATIPNAIAIAELAVEKQAKVLLMPVSARRDLMMRCSRDWALGRVIGVDAHVLIR